jgi:hypothetical protein
MPDRPASRKYRSEVDHRGKPGSVFQEAHEATRLLEAPRKVRIEAMKRFPALLKTLNAEAKAAVAGIEATQKLVS